MKLRLRLLSLIILACIILLIVKLSGVLREYDILSELFYVSSAFAQEKSEDETESENDVVEAQKPPLAQDGQVNYSKEELKILNRLSERRKKLSQWEKDLSIKQNVLDITQTKINNKINELRQLKADIEKNLSTYNKKESAKTKALIKVYENMKPKAAAKIFSSLEMDTLISIVKNMKEDRLALILAKMNPDLASEITLTFAQHGKLIPTVK